MWVGGCVVGGGRESTISPMSSPYIAWLQARVITAAWLYCWGWEVEREEGWMTTHPLFQGLILNAKCACLLLLIAWAGSHICMQGGHSSQSKHSTWESVAKGEILRVGSENGGFIRLIMPILSLAGRQALWWRCQSGWFRFTQGDSSSIAHLLYFI